MTPDTQQQPRKSIFDDYFERIQSRKKLPRELQESLTSAFANIPVSSFPEVPRGKVIEISADTSVADAVRILSEHNILAAPVTDPDAFKSLDWQTRYIGILDYSSIILWVLENAELAAAALSAGSAAAAGMGVGALGAVGALAMGATAPAAVAGLTMTAVGAAVAGGIATERGAGRDAPTAVGCLGKDFFHILSEEEPFKSSKVRSIIKSYRSAPFVPVAVDSSMLSVLLLLSKYRLRNVPVIEMGKSDIQNFVTQSAVVQGLEKCKGRDWFDCIAAHSLRDLGLPFMSPNEVIYVDKDELVLEAFKRMKDNEIGGLPVVEGPKRKIIGNVSIRDIRILLLKPEIISTFRHMTVMDFMSTGAEASQGIEHTIMVPPVTCMPGDPLGGVISTLASKAIHRVYVIGEESEVLGIVTLRDVISCFIYEPPGYLDSYIESDAKEVLTRWQNLQAQNLTY